MKRQLISGLIIIVMTYLFFSELENRNDEFIIYNATIQLKDGTEINAKEVHLPSREGAFFLAIKNDGGEIMINPKALEVIISDK